MAMSASEARASFFPLLKRVNDDHDVVHITSRQYGNAVLMSEEDWRGWQETVYLLRSPANASRLLEAIARDQEGDHTSTVTMATDELTGLADDE
ncbi:type II toxin-antitoxin system Phd/YefM family antitoxin [Nocardiopsis algeriensis]|uniref:Antitoxin n=1 Tax=Nocardiopsis algeriensis TaxID=1478215 RepID=A0A841IXP2_9ACTN|nr:type II toxin-antitoxin system Phd/YefM family antitoxin [Nocardiopsis algeriensis]MBB6122046.1 antitoxin YefM [Nocardiopsis algeriensis]